MTASRHTTLRVGHRLGALTRHEHISILEIYTALAESMQTGKAYQTRLDPPPADLRALFSKSNRLKSELRDVLDEAVFHGFGLRVDKVRSQKRLVLGVGERGVPLPFMVWSAGQREFVPLLLGLYWLLPGAISIKRSRNT